MRRESISHLLPLVILPLLLGCSSDKKTSNAANTVGRMAQFIETGDTTLLQGVFTDSVLALMSIDQMLTTRDDFLARFGSLRTIDGPKFLTDSTANLVLRYELMSLLAELEFTPKGQVRFLSIRPEPVKSNTDSSVITNLEDLDTVSELQAIFNIDTEYVRLVAILSPT